MMIPVVLEIREAACQICPKQKTDYLKKKLCASRNCTRNNT